MIPLKARITDLVFSVARSVPFIVSRRLRFLALSYSQKSSYQLQYEEMDDLVKRASLWDSKTDWRGVHVLLSVSKSECSRIVNYLHRYGRDFNFRLSDKKLDVGFFGSGTRSLGSVSFSGDTFSPVMKLALVSDAPSYCAVDVLHLPNGYSYLSLYVGLNPVATQRVSDIDVTTIKRYVAFNSLNPFSKNFKVVTDYARYNLIEDHVYERATQVAHEAIDCTLVLLNLWGVKKSKADLTTVADFSRDSELSYFDAEEENVTAHRSVIEKTRGLLAEKFPGAPGDELLTFNLPPEIGVDGIFIHSEDRANIDQMDQYLYSRQTGVQMYAVFLYLRSLEKDLKACEGAVAHLFDGSTTAKRSMFNAVLSRILNRDSARSERNLRTLISQTLSLNVIDERIDSLQKSLHWFDSAYIEYFKSRLIQLGIAVRELKGKIESRHHITNAEVQLSNLHWMKRYSGRMFVLVVVQIFLAVIVLDWSSSEADKNLLRKNYHAFIERYFSSEGGEK